MASKVSQYYKHPDGQDVIGKLAYTCKVTGLLGLGAGFIDAQMYSKPKGYLGALGRIIFWTGPAVGVAAAFTTVTYMATNLRNKDDSINYALGGIAAGSVVGAWRRSVSFGLLASAALAISAVVKKEGVLAGFEFFPTSAPVQHRSIGAQHYDFTLAKDIPGNWTTGEK